MSIQTSDIITQVSADGSQGVPQVGYEDQQQYESFDYASNIHLDVRGVPFTITRDELMSLPESILLCLFPQGVFVDYYGNVITNLTEEDVAFVAFEPEGLEYVLQTFRDAADKTLTMEMPVQSENENDLDVLSGRPAIVVLREDLDYYVISPHPKMTQEEMKNIKRKVGKMLEKQNLVFDGLNHDNSSTNRLGPAEQHLIEMLCASGFDISGKWGSRHCEPDKTVITSLSLVPLQHDEAESNTPGISHKLLLFWRKPARKCWWSNQMVTLDDVEGVSNVKVHIRRVWTLELSVIGVR